MRARGHQRRIAALCDFVFECEDEDGNDTGYRFGDAWEMNVDDYTYHFVWACHVLSTAATWLRRGDARVPRPNASTGAGSGR